MNLLYSIARIIFFFDRRIFAWFIAIFLAPGLSNAGEFVRQATLSEDGSLLRDGWHFVSERHGTRVFNRSWAGSPIPEVLARVVIHVPPKRLYAVITDYDHFTEFLPYVTSSRILRREGEIRFVHQRLHLPAPLADRYYTIASTQVRLPENIFRVEWHIVPDSGVTTPGEEGLIPSAFSGFWELTPNEDGTVTHAVYSIRFDPGGAVPSWLATLAMNRYVPKVVEAVRAKAMQPVVGDARESNPPDVKPR